MSTRGRRSSRRYNIHTYEVTGNVVLDGRRQKVTYFEAAWVVPSEMAPGKRKQIKATSRRSAVEAQMRCEEKVDAFLATNGENLPGNEKARRVRKAAVPVNSLRTDHTVQEFLEEWYEAQVESDRWVQNSAIRIKQTFRDYIYPFLGSKPLNELTKKDVRVHFTKTLPGLMRLDKDGRPTSKRRIEDGKLLYTFTNFRAAIRAADAKNFTDGDPTFQIHMPKKPEPHGEDREIEELLYELLKVFANPKNDDVMTLRFAISFFMGMRRGERCGLQWADIDDLNADEPVIKVQRQLGYTSKKQGGEGHFFTPSTKTGRAREVPLQEHVVDLLRIHRKRVDEWQKSPNWNPDNGYGDLILIRENGKFYDLNKDNELWAKWLKDVGLNMNGVAPGALRHASATWWATVNEQDENFLRDVLGWSKKSDLTRYYTRKNQKSLKTKMKSSSDWRNQSK